MTDASDVDAVATFLDTAITQLGGQTRPLTVLDFGCGAGRLVQALVRRGFDAYGCDVAADWTGEERLRPITPSPYRLPFDDGSIDVVVSTSVLEHAQNKEECFREIHRVLRPGGSAMHLYPGRWYLPYEPHIYVPFVNIFWPRCPTWWLALWALLGVRNEFQRGLPWRAVTAANERYCREGLSYWTTRQYRELSLRVFGHCHWPMAFYLTHAPGGFARLSRRLPFKPLSGAVSREMRMGFMMQRKSSSSPRSA